MISLEWRRSRVGKLSGMVLLALVMAVAYGGLLYWRTGDPAVWAPIVLLRAVVVAIVLIPFLVGFGKLFFGFEALRYQEVAGAVLGVFVAIFDTFVSISGLMFGELAVMPEPWTIWGKAPSFAALGVLLGWLARRDRRLGSGGAHVTQVR